MRKIKFEFDKNSVKKIFASFIKRRRLFFIIFFGALLIFTFDVIYKNVYFNINYIDYTETEDFEINGARKSIMLKKVIENINYREQLTQNEVSKKYRNPFDFDDSENLGEGDIDGGSDGENDNESGSNDKNGDDSYNYNNPAIPLTEPIALPER